MSTKKAITGGLFIGVTAFSAILIIAVQGRTEHTRVGSTVPFNGLADTTLVLSECDGGAHGDSGQVDSAKEVIIYAVIGIVVIGIAAALVNFVVGAVVQ